MKFVDCVQCRTPTPEWQIDDLGECAACVRGAKPEPTDDELRMDALAQHRERMRGINSEKDAALQQTPKKVLADAELARRELARRRLLPFMVRFNPEYKAGWVHKVICAELEEFEQAVIAEKSPRLIIEMGPRHGKSEPVSRNFPAWFLGRNPGKEVIAASHTASLSMDFSRKVRGIVRNPSFKPVFKECELDPDIQSAEQWKTTRGGTYTAVGVGSAVVGKGAHVLIIDDPLKGAEDAESFSTREAIKNWYQTEAYTRLAPGGGVLIIMQRWHDDDLVGHLLKKEAEVPDDEKEGWKVVRFPAIAIEDETYRRAGEALHPERYPLKALERIRRNMTPRQWEALYQQNPVPDTGTYFTTDMIRYYDPEDCPPLAEMNTYATWDLAIGEKEQNDYSASFTGGLSRNDDLYILDRVKERMPSHDIVEALLDKQKLWKAQVVGLERGHIQMTLGPYLSKRMAERRQMGFLLHPLTIGRRDKQARARSIQGRMQQGKVLFPRNAPWVMDVVRELLQFPNGAHDDQVDALAYLGLMLDEMVVTRPKPEPVKKGWVDRLKKPVVGSAAGSMSA